MNHVTDKPSHLSGQLRAKLSSWDACKTVRGSGPGIILVALELGRVMRNHMNLCL